MVAEAIGIVSLVIAVSSEETADVGIIAVWLVGVGVGVACACTKGGGCDGGG